MRFWDGSSVLALAVREPGTERLEKLLRRDPEVVLWWGTAVHCAGALANAQRDGRVVPADQPKARAVIDHLRSRAFEIQPLEEVRARALRLLAVHPLAPAEALELAAALVWCRERTQGVGFVSVDDKLRQAAALENFRVLPYADEIHDDRDDPDGD